MNQQLATTSLTSSKRFILSMLITKMFKYRVIMGKPTQSPSGTSFSQQNGLTSDDFMIMKHNNFITINQRSYS